MAFEDKKGIIVASPFKLQAEALLDVRQQVDTIAERDRLVTLKAATAGLRVFVKENSTSYVYTGSKWDPLATGAPYKHPTGDGNHHVPATGTTNAGKYLKAGATAGSEAWSNIAASDITGLPTRLPNPQVLKFTGAATATYDGSGAVTVNIPTSGTTDASLTLQMNGGTTESTNKFTFNGSAAKTVNITPELIGAAAASHTHPASQITGLPTSLKNPYALTVKTNGTSAAVYDGSVAKEVNITASSVGAAAASHGHSTFKGATASAAGGTGFVPTPGVGENNKYLRGDGTWQPISLTLAALGVTATAAELNYMKGVTSAVQTQLNGKAAASHTHPASQITGLPTSLKNPYALTVRTNGTAAATYDGSAAKEVNITPAAIGAAAASHSHSGYAPTSHTHKIANITDIANAAVASAGGVRDSGSNVEITISYYEAATTTFSYIPVFTEATHIGNITKANFRSVIDAAPASHTHNYAGSSSAGGPANSAKKVDVPVGTVMWSTSASSIFFAATMGGTWEVVGNIDAIIDTSTSITFYLHKKKAL